MHFSKYDTLLQGKETQNALQIADMMIQQQLSINQINRKEGKPEVYVHAHVHNLRRTKPSNKPQLHVPGLQATKGLTWFRDGDIIVNHIWPPDIDRRKGIMVNIKPTITPRPNTNAPKHKQAEEYHDDNAMKRYNPPY